MVDHPILFSKPMVRALFIGRKTMTRRHIAKARVFATPDRPSWTLKGSELVRAMQNASGFRRLENNGWYWEADAYSWQAPAERTGWMAYIGYAPGDRLWVRETWATVNTGGGPGWAYKADGGFIQPEYDGEDFGAGPSFDYEKYPGDYSMWISDLLAGSSGHKWKPSIHMPRWASRLTLVVTDVRVERLQDISEADAIAEGVEHDSDGWRDYLMPHTQCCASATDSFGTLWDSINGPGAWEANPWVSVTVFTAHRQNIDQMEAA